MARAFDPDARIRFVLPADEALPADQQPAFFFKQLTIFEQMDLDAKFPNGATKENFVAYALEMLRLTLVGWERFKYAGGVEAAFEVDARGRASDKTIARAQDYLLPLFKAAVAANRVEADAVGKS